MPTPETLETEVLRVLREADGRRVTAGDIAIDIEGDVTREQVCRAMSRLRSKGVPIKFSTGGQQVSWYWLGRPLQERPRRRQSR